VDTSAAFRDRYIETEGEVTHSHGREGDHSHAGAAFTTWLDLSQAAQQARAVHDALSRRMPDQADTFSTNFHALEHDLLDLDARLEAITARDHAQPLLASHPVYQYLARRYSLNLKSVMWEPDAMPPESNGRHSPSCAKGTRPPGCCGKTSPPRRSGSACKNSVYMTLSSPPAETALNQATS